MPSPTPPDLPEHLPGEPVEVPLTGMPLAADLVRRALRIAARALLMAPLWPIYLLLRLFVSRPPIVPSAAKHLRVLRHALTARPPAPGLSLSLRVRIVLALIERWVWVPAWGFAWLFDELLYGRQLQRVPLQAPIFELSASRSGSTQLAHYLEGDPQIRAPGTLQCVLPFVWLWQIAVHTVAHWVTREQVQRWGEAWIPPAMLQRHEFDPYHTDSFEVLFLYGHLGDLISQLGPTLFVDECSPAATTDANREYWSDFLRYLDRISRKVLLFHGPGRLMIKGHFLAVIEDLERTYPDARFLTVVREPDKRFQSAINFARYQPTEYAFPPIPWSWLVERHMNIETTYCVREMDWYQRAGARRCVIPFRTYVRDLEGTMRQVFRDCLDGEPGEHVPKVHAPRVRTDYMVDRSLEQLGIDTAALEQRLAAYYRWSKGEPAAATAD